MIDTKAHDKGDLKNYTEIDDALKDMIDEY